MEREEGELTDEDLEDISDTNSLATTPILSGKSSSLAREPFRELSLTAVSDDTDDKEYRINAQPRDIKPVCHRHRPRREQRRYSGTKRVRRNSDRRIVRRRTSSVHKDYSSVSSSSDESDYYSKNETILRQLSDAVRINHSQKLPNCSLKTRLKGMILPDSNESKNNSEDDNDINTLRDLALQSKTKKGEENETSITDNDLIELRINALQSAVLKKHQNRRKNKEEQLKKQLKNEENKTDSPTKENVEKNENSVDNNNVATDNKNDDIKSDDNVKSIEEDEAILRAMLLSSISNQNNKNTENKSGKKSENDEAILRDILIYNNNTESAQSNEENEKNVQTTDNEEKTEPKNNVDEDEDILRAMLLANISKKIANEKNTKKPNNILVNKHNINLNKIINSVPKSGKLPSDTKNTVSLPSVPVNRLIINLNDDSDSDCDQTITKPEKGAKSEDLFNQSLSMFLQQARAKSDAEKKSDISHLPKPQQLEYRRLQRKIQQLTKNKHKITAQSKQIEENNKLKLNKQKLPLSEQQNIKDDRLQVKGKYEVLGPLMTKVSEARVARDKAQAEVKKLINDLRIARVELTTKHQTFTVLMQKLVKEKSVIDKRLNPELKPKNNIPSICTSTPNKSNSKQNPESISSCDLSSISENVNQNEIIQNQVEDNEIKDDNEVKDMEIEKDSEKTVVPMEIEEPVEEEMKKSGVVKYNSPLDHIQINREYDPLVILCPYDLLGICRDASCAYLHCKNSKALTD